MESGIYCIENIINQKKYIGSSKHIKNRFIKHLSRLRRNKHFNRHLQRSWHLYKEENFKFYPLEKCDIKILVKREKYWMDKYNVLNRKYGYNIHPDPTTHNHSEETKRKISIANKGKVRTLQARKNLCISKQIMVNSKDYINPFKGKKHSNQTKEKISKANSKPILQYSKNSKFIKEWESITEAYRKLNIHDGNICLCAKGTRKSAGNYIWRYKN